MDHMHVFVKVDLLLHEETFDALRKFLSNETANIPNHCSLEFIDGEIKSIPFHPIYANAMSNLIGQKIEDGYMLILVKKLKTMVSLN